MKSKKQGNRAPVFSLLTIIAYTQPVGFGSPAYLHACFAGPAGNNSYRYFVFPFSGPIALPSSFDENLDHRGDLELYEVFSEELDDLPVFTGQFQTIFLRHKPCHPFFPYLPVD